jgi:small subunit ribosomal protein S16
MPVKLRLKRQGRSKAAHYAIVAADSRSPRDGRYIEKIGTYNPITEPAKIYVDHDAALKWLKVGAQPTHTVRSILRHAGVTVKFALSKQGKSEEEAERIFSKWWEAKKAKKKKKMVSCDIHGNPLEEVPMQEKPKPAPTPEPEAEAPAEEPAAEETPAEDAPVAEETAEAPAEETPAEEEKKDE